MTLRALLTALLLLASTPAVASPTSVTVTSAGAVEITLTVPQGVTVAKIEITVNVVQAPPPVVVVPGPVVPPVSPGSALPGVPVVVTPTSGWTPPIGIPYPPIGVLEVSPPRPDPWTAEVPLFYYVDQSAANASDQRTFGNPLAPRKTIPIALPAGAVVELHGVYDYAPMGYSSAIGGGTSAKPIFIRGRGPSERPTIRREFHILGTYMVLEHLIFSVGSPVLLAPAHHVAIRDCDISGDLKSGGLLVVSWSADRGHDFVILRNVIHDNGDWRATFDQDKHGIGLGNVDNVWILDNEMTRNSGDGLQINAGNLTNQPRTHHIYVGRNRSHHNKQSGMWTKQAVDVVFSQNTIWTHRPSDSSPGGGMGFQYAPERVWFLWNDVTDCDMGIYTGSDSSLGSGTEAFAIGNKIHGIHRTKPVAVESGWSPAAMTLAGGLRWTIVGNTLDDVEGGVYSPNSAGTFHLEANSLTRVVRAPILVEGGQVVNDQGLYPGLRARYKVLHGVDLPAKFEEGR